MLRSWRIAISAAPVMRKWGDQFVVHHALSNDTYRLSEAAGRLLIEFMAADVEHAGGTLRADSMEGPEAEASLSALVSMGVITEC